MILQSLEQLFELSSISRLQQRLERLFDLRDAGVHSWEATQIPVEHVDIPGMNVSLESALFGVTAVTEAIDLALQLIAECTQNPLNRRVARWAHSNADGIARLIEARQTGNFDGC